MRFAAVCTWVINVAQAERYYYNKCKHMFACWRYEMGSEEDWILKYALSALTDDEKEKIIDYLNTLSTEHETSSFPLVLNSQPA